MAKKATTTKATTPEGKGEGQSLVTSAPTSKEVETQHRPTGADASFFLPYQVRWIKDESPLLLMEKARQIGMSWATAYKAVRRCAVKGARLDVWWSSRDDCKAWAALLQIAAQDQGEQVIDLESGAKAYVLEFATGCRIHCLSSNPNALAGKRGHVILDEFALHKDQRLLYRIAKPVTQWGGTLTIISTHRGVATVFNEIIKDIREKGNPMGWSHHRVTLQDAVDQGIVEKINTKKAGDRTPHPGPLPAGEGETREAFLARTRAECLDEEQWQQEYCCVPSDDSTAFLPYDVITACEDGTLKTVCASTLGSAAFAYLLDCKNPLYVGIDVGRRKDLTVVDVEEKVGDVMVERMRLELQGKKFSEQEAEIWPILALPQVRRVCQDASGLGMQLAERAQERFGNYKIEAVTFTGPVKEELAFPLKARFEDRRARIPRDAALKEDLRRIKKETTAAGNIRFVAESSEADHSDRFWAKALAYHAGATNTVPTPPVVFETRRNRVLSERRERSLVG